MSVVAVGVGKSRMVSMYFGKGSMVSSRYAEPCEVNNSPREIEFLCVEGDSCLAYTDEKGNGCAPVRL